MAEYGCAITVNMGSVRARPGVRIELMEEGYATPRGFANAQSPDGSRLYFHVLSGVSRIKVRSLKLWVTQGGHRLGWINVPRMSCSPGSSVTVRLVFPQSAATKIGRSRSYQRSLMPSVRYVSKSRYGFRPRFSGLGALDASMTPLVIGLGLVAGAAWMGRA